MTQDPYGAVAPPLYQTATFDQVSAVACGPYDYTRSGNPTRDQLEAQMADLEVLPTCAPLKPPCSMELGTRALKLHSCASLSALCATSVFAQGRWLCCWEDRGYAL